MVLEYCQRKCFFFHSQQNTLHCVQRWNRSAVRKLQSHQSSEGTTTGNEALLLLGVSVLTDTLYVVLHINNTTSALQIHKQRSPASACWLLDNVWSVTFQLCILSGLGKSEGEWVCYCWWLITQITACQLCSAPKQRQVRAHTQAAENLLLQKKTSNTQIKYSVITENVVNILN